MFEYSLSSNQTRSIGGDVDTSAPIDILADDSGGYSEELGYQSKMDQKF